MINTKVRRAQRIKLIAGFADELSKCGLRLVDMSGWRILYKHKSELASRIVKQAREKIGYSLKTSDWDIICAMKRAYNYENKL